jgi:uncharacterized protein (TIGR02145 family)
MKIKKITLFVLILFCMRPVGLKAQTLKDIEGNVYPTVNIGTQVWMAENLKTTKYNDGMAMPLVSDNNAWEALKTPGYCWYNNDAAANKNRFGALYNWYTVNTKKLCPAGWHVPNDKEWTTLRTYLGGEEIAGGKLKETGTTHWTSPNTDATNQTGFTALPGGGRRSNGEFFGLGTQGFFWSIAEEMSDTMHWGVGYNHNGLNTYEDSNGFSIRCVKDN